MPSRMGNVKGLTLIEIMVVVVLIGIILAIAIPYYIHYKKGTCDKVAQSDLLKMGAAIEVFNSRLVDLGCDMAGPTDPVAYWTTARIGSLVGDYYGWSGTNEKCDVRISVSVSVSGANFTACAVQGADAGGGNRVIYTLPTKGGAKISSSTGACQGDRYLSGNNTEDMLGGSCPPEF